MQVLIQMVGKTGFEPATPWSQTKCSTKLSHFPIYMVRSKGFEPLTFWFVAKHSIQLSYGRIKACVKLQKIIKIKNGGSSGNRTSDTGIFSPLLYQLSYEAIMAVPTGLEPAIFCVTGRRVNQLHQGTIYKLNWLREEDLNL